MAGGPTRRGIQIQQLADMSMANPVGRPRKYETPEDFDRKVEEYYAYCKQEKEPVTWTGLALYLGFSSRQSIDEYLHYEGFSDSVKRAKALVEWHYEMRLVTSSTPTGAIFALKNFGWSDKHELAHTSPDGSMTPKSITATDPIEAAKQYQEIMGGDE